MLPSVIGKGLAYGINIGISLLFYRQQSPIYKQHIANGGKKASILIPLLICVVISAAFIVLYIFYAANIPDNKIDINGSEVYYTEAAGKAEAEKLGAYLSQAGYFTADSPSSVKIDRAGNEYIVSVVIDLSYLNDPQTITGFTEVANLLSTEVFGGAGVQVNICNDRFQIQQAVFSE